MRNALSRILTICVTALSFLAMAANGPRTAVAGDLSSSLHRAAKDVVTYCKQNDIQSVGTLKFLVARDGKLSDNVGTINKLLAKRLDVALVLTNNPREPLTLIDDASATAKSIKGASHLNREDRAKLFTVDYHAMWGDQKVRPDALVTGIAEVSADLKSIQFALVIATASDNKLSSIGDYSATITPAILTETGESFSTRGAFDGGKIVTTNAGTPSDLPDDLDPGTKTILTSAKRVRDESTKHPLSDPQAVVKLKVMYDGQLVPFEIRDGSAFLREPNQGQRVELIAQKDATSTRYGIVVKVNGQNTLRKQQRPDAKCGKWILSQPNQQVAIRGYQMNNNELEQFRVLSKTESKEREVDYGSEVGTLSITVFREGSPPKLELDDDARESQIVETAKLPEEPSATFGALKAKLLADANRGLIAEGNRVQGAVKVVKFHADETPVMTATATYYQP